MSVGAARNTPLQAEERAGAEPLVSVIMPSYNHASFVAEAIRSIAAQTYPNLELIVIDDGSRDDTPEVIKNTLATLDRDMHIDFQCQENAGVCMTLNRGLERARGEFVQFIASDDAYLPEKTARSVNALAASGSSMAAVYCDGYVIDRDGRRIGNFSQLHPVPFGRNTYRELLVGNWIPAMGTLYRMQVIRNLGGFDPGLKAEDWDLLLRLARVGTIGRISERLVLYRRHPGNLSKNAAAMEEVDRALAARHPDLARYFELRANLRRSPLRSLAKYRDQADLPLRWGVRKIQRTLSRVPESL